MLHENTVPNGCRTMRIITIIGTFIGFCSVTMGAAKDHMLDGYLTEQTAERFDVAIHYHQLYTVVIFVLGLYGTTTRTGKIYTLATLLFLCGILAFCGSLYAGIWFDLGPIAYATPTGGILLMTGWVVLAVHFLRTVRRSNV